MTFYVSWSGLGRDLPAFGALVNQGGALDPANDQHATHVGHLIEHWASEHPDEKLQLTLSGNAQEIDTGVHSTLSLSLTTTPATPEEAAMDVSQSNDPFAPENPQPAADAQPDPQAAGADPAVPVEGSDAAAPAAGTEAHDAPVPGETEEALEHSAIEAPGVLVTDQPLAGTGEAVNAETGEITPSGEPLPEVSAAPGSAPLEPAVSPEEAASPEPTEAAPVEDANAVQEAVAPDPGEPGGPAAPGEEPVPTSPPSTVPATAEPSSSPSDAQPDSVEREADPTTQGEVS